ncbi:uncharacterized protein METZ01_LOCUS134566 [marine metagenome]|uniref:TnsA endonuclease N-terminal domain-containing protein n=1 Tax=marine metagenome TaxID=408172 RepID=A0A381YYJ9_9ZZZZ
MAKFAQGRFSLKNADKYLGRKTPLYRSSWEFAFMRFCDESPSVAKWASESIRIPYKDPLTGKLTIYVPDFMIQYTDAKGKGHVEVVEVKPQNQMTKEGAGRDKYKQAQYVRNMAKWEAARAWCNQRKIFFRVINENDIFHKPKAKRK